MKKVFYLLLLTLCFLPFNVKADSATLTMNCSSNEPSKGEEIACTINLSSESVINSVAGTLSFDPALVEYSSTSTNGLTGNNLLLEDSSPSGLSKTSPITTVYLKIKDNATESTGTTPNVTITLTNIQVETSTPETLNLSNISDSVRVLSTNNSLASLTIASDTISLTSATSYSYTLSSDVASTNIVWTKSHPNQVITMSFKGSTISTNTISNLDYGNNTITIVVDPEDGANKTYTITVTRPDNRSTINTLSELSIEDSSKTYSINFSSTVTSYTVNVTSNISAITINATRTDTKSSFVTNYMPGIKAVDYGKNTYYLKVQSESGVVKTYTIIINRTDNRSSNSYLKTLKLDYGKLTFDKDILEYTVTVPYTVTNIIIDEETEDSASDVKITGGKDLVVGENTITIKVTAENETTKEYKIIVTRQEQSALAPSNNTYLSKLLISNYNLDFNKEIYKYDLTIKSQDKSLSITTSTEDSKASYRILNNENLAHGSQIKIRVTAEDGTTKDYILNIRVKSNLDVALLIAISALSLGIVILIIVIIMKNKNNKDKIIVINSKPNSKDEIPALEEEYIDSKTQKIVFTSKKDV